MSISIREMLEAGAHFGHQTHRWNPKMRPYIYGARNGIYIINLEKTAAMWRSAYQAIATTVARGNKVLFVGTKPQAQEVVVEEATRAGQFFVERRWLGGMLTNFTTIRSRLKRLDELEKLKTTPEFEKFPKKEQMQLEKERQKLERGLNGIRALERVPGMLVVIDPKKEHLAIKEAQKLQIPIVAITDTNCDPDGIHHVIPANDDALKSIRLFLHSAADACLEGGKQFEERIQEETRRRMESEKHKGAAGESNVRPDPRMTGGFEAAAVGTE